MSTVCYCGHLTCRVYDFNSEICAVSCGECFNARILKPEAALKTVAEAQPCKFRQLPDKCTCKECYCIAHNVPCECGG
jgi:hypothetical protein